MNINEAQQDMKLAYIGGGTGVLVSGLVWMIAALVAVFISPKASILTLFFGGMFIFPLSVVLDKLLGRSGKHNSDNPLSSLALESTVLLFVGLFLAFCISQIKLDWFYSVMLMIIGARYLVFQTLYGMKIYWVIGGLLILAGGACIVLNQPFVYAAFIGAAIELIFGFIIIKNN